MNEIIASSFNQQNTDETVFADMLAFFDISGTDQSNTAELAEISDKMGGQIIDAFYEHLLRFDVAARHFTSDEQIERVQKAQTTYFHSLLGAELDAAYIEDRRRIGSIHERAGVTPSLYIGAYAYYLKHLGHIVLDVMEANPRRASEMVLSLMKLAMFDMSLALERYVEARENTIEQRERELSELPTPVLKLRDGLLLIPVVGTLDSYRARSLTVQLLEGIRGHRARAVVLDITGVAAVDSAVANHLIQTMTAARLMGADSVLTGMSAEVAQALVKVGVTGEQLNTAGDLQQGIQTAEDLLRD